VRRQIPAAHPGPDEQAAQPHHPVQVRSPLVHRPADPTIARVKLQGRSGEGQPSQPAVGRIHEVVQLPPHQGARAAGVFRDQKLVPDAPLLLGFDAYQAELPNGAGRLRHPFGEWDGLPQPARLRASG